MRRQFVISVETVIFLVLLLGGCTSRYKTEPMPVLTQPVFEERDPALNPGSLFDSNGSEFLFDDNRASRVGDIVMVAVAEQTDSSLKSETSADKNNAHQTGIRALPEKGILGSLPIFGALGADVGTNIDASQSSKFAGTGETKQKSSFVATVATRIVRRLPGNLLQVEGARRIRVNNETQFLVVRGLLRQRDINSENSIPSTKLAEAQIEIYGQGVLADKQRPGWLSRLLDNIFPF